MSLGDLRKSIGKKVDLMSLLQGSCIKLYVFAIIISSLRDLSGDRLTPTLKGGVLN